VLRSENRWSCTSTSPVRLHGVVLSWGKHRESITYNVYCMCYKNGELNDSLVRMLKYKCHSTMFHGWIHTTGCACNDKLCKRLYTEFNLECRGNNEVALVSVPSNSTWGSPCIKHVQPPLYRTSVLPMQISGLF